MKLSVRSITRYQVIVGAGVLAFAMLTSGVAVAQDAAVDAETDAGVPAEDAPQALDVGAIGGAGGGLESAGGGGGRATGGGGGGGNVGGNGGAVAAGGAGGASGAGGGVTDGGTSDGPRGGAGGTTTTAPVVIPEDDAGCSVGPGASGIMGIMGWKTGGLLALLLCGRLLRRRRARR